MFIVCLSNDKIIDPKLSLLPFYLFVFETGLLYPKCCMNFIVKKQKKKFDKTCTSKKHRYRCKLKQ